jgi:hypothetical protein
LGLFSIPPVFFKYRNFSEFTRNVYWTRSDKASSVSGYVYGMIPLHFDGSQKIKNLRVFGSNPSGGRCHVSIWENFATNGRYRRSIVGVNPSGSPFDVMASPSGSYYVTNPTDFNYALWAYAFGNGIEINLYNIEIEAIPIG